MNVLNSLYIYFHNKRIKNKCREIVLWSLVQKLSLHLSIDRIKWKKQDTRNFLIIVTDLYNFHVMSRILIDLIFEKSYKDPWTVKLFQKSLCNKDFYVQISTFFPNINSSISYYIDSLTSRNIFSNKSKIICCN